MAKRIAAMLLSACMMLTLLPTAFAADGDVAQIGSATYPSLAAAVAAAEDDTIVLQASTNENITIPETKSITLDLNGYTLNGGTVSGKAALTNEGTVIIKDSSADGTGTIKREDTGGSAYYVILNKGTMTIESGNVLNNSGFDTNGASGSSLIRNLGTADKNAVLTINGGTFTQEKFIAIKNDDYGVLTMTGGTINATGSDGNITVSAIQNWSEATITGGTINGAIWTSVWSDKLPDSKTVIDGETVKVTGRVVAEPYDGLTGKTVNVEIKDGDFDLEWRVAESADVSVAVTGGTFAQAIPDAYVADGFTSVDNGEGKFILGEQTDPIGAVAEINGQYFKTLDGAIAAAGDEDTIVLQDDVAFTGTISLNSGRVVNIDLNGHNIAFTPSEGMSQSGFLVGKSTLNLAGKGMLYETAPNYSPIMVYGATEDVADYSVVNVGKDVTLQGWAPIFINGNAVEGQPRAAYGIQITVEGTLESVNDTSGAAGHGVYINGSNSRTDGNVPVITLTETSNVTSKGNGIYAAGYAVWNLAGNVTGEDSLSIKSGTFHITGGTYTATGAYSDPVANGNGSENTGAAISITSNKAYAPKTEINVTGGTFVSQNGYAFYEGIAQKDGVPAADASYATLAVSGGTFTGNSEKGAVSINEAEKKDIITGGTFSSDVSTYVPGTHDEAMLSESSYTVGQYNDSNVTEEAGAQTDMAARRTLSSGTTVYYATLADAVASYTSGDVALTLLSDSTEAIEVSSPMTISKNGYTAQGLTAAAGISMVESDDSYVFYPTIETTPDTTYSIQYQLEKLDGSGYDNAGDPVTGISGDAVEATIQEAVKGYAGYSLSSIELADTTYTVKLNRNVYTIIFESDGAIVSQQSLKFGEPISAPAQEPVKDRYTFRGWSGYTDGMTVDSDATFQASWKRNSSGGATITKPTTMYAVSIDSGENGRVSADRARASGGSEVTLTVKPDEGYVLDSLTVTGSNGNDVALSDNEDGKYTFIMPDSAVTVTATFREDTGEEPENPENPADGLPFADVTEEDWFYDAVSYVYENGLMNGTSSTAFEPNLTTTRGMIVTMLYRMENSPAVTGAASFMDVASGQYYANAVAWAAANGIVNGYDADTFGPDDAITREQLAAILYRYASYKGYDVTATADMSAYTDADDISTWAQAAMGWANAEGLVTGVTNTTLEPTGSATRACAAEVLMRFCESVAK